MIAVADGAARHLERLPQEMRVAFRWAERRDIGHQYLSVSAPPYVARFSVRSASLARASWYRTSPWWNNNHQAIRQFQEFVEVLADQKHRGARGCAPP